MNLWSSEKAREKLSLQWRVLQPVRNCISQDQTVVKKKKSCAKSQRTHFLSVLTDRVHWPSAIVRVTPLYWMCRRVVYLRVAFLHHIHAANVCEKFVNCEQIFCMNPVCVCVCMCACFIFHSSFVVIYQISKFQAPNLVSVWSYFYIRALSIENASECDSLFS